MVTSLSQRALGTLPPEWAHALALRGLDVAARVPGLLGRAPAPDPRRVFGLRFPNPVGLAAGLDKNGDHIDALGRLGFGSIEIGTVTPRPQPGNPRPRLFRIPERQALINRMGFNNKGARHAAERLERRRFRGIVGANIGKNRETPLDDALGDYRACLETLHGVADYVTVNVSSPNTPGLRELQSGEAFERLLDGLAQTRARLQSGSTRHVPVLLKIAPDNETHALERIAEGVVGHGLDGVIATNTTADHTSVADCRHGGEQGGLSGAPLAQRSTTVLRQLAQAVDARVPLVGVGGIMGADDARAKRDAGAALVQVYTGLIYRGPALVGEMARALRD